MSDTREIKRQLEELELRANIADAKARIAEADYRRLHANERIREIKAGTNPD